MILYKYRGDNQFTESIFKNKQIWLSNASGLNDPFECSMQEIASEWINEKVTELKQAHLMPFISSALFAVKTKTSFYGLTHTQTKQYLKKFKARSFDEQYSSFRDFTQKKTGVTLSDPDKTFTNFDNQLNQVGIFSLSESAKVQLMWAHYANNSTGIAIGFNIDPNITNQDHCHLLKVNYSDELPKMNEGFQLVVEFFANGQNKQKISFSDSTLKKVISTKSTPWEYEKEWRYVEEGSGSRPLPGKIQEIIFGLRCPAEIRKKYRNFVSEYIDNRVKYFEVVNPHNTNQIVLSEIT